MAHLQRRLAHALEAAKLPARDVRSLPPEEVSPMSRLSRVLPASPSNAIALDALLARHSTPRPDTPPRPSARPSQMFAQDEPTALVLCVNTHHCVNCGHDTVSGSGYILVKYAVNEHSFRYSRAELRDSELSLPRERRETTYNVPFCNECF